MIVTIWRHGEAAWAAGDRQRELTAAGTDDVGFGCHHFHDLCHQRSLPNPDLVLHSDWTRASQTADIISSAFTHAGMRVSHALRPGSTIAAVEDAISKLQAMPDCPDHVVLVTHQPLVSRLVDHFLGERGRVPSLSPGGLAAMEMDLPGADCARLLFWGVPPQYEGDS
jgi:phosphohistidine phosphatase